MATYDQMVTIYGTITVDAESKREAKRKISRQIQRLSFSSFFHEAEITIGDVERESEIKRMEEGE